MAIWKDSSATKSETPNKTEKAGQQQTEKADSNVKKPEATVAQRREREIGKRGEMAESVITADLTIEGKIEGSGHVRLVGTFKGDVQVKGNLTIEPGARVSGSVRADKVVVGGELEGNVEKASRVELLETGVVNGDVKAESVTVAAGSRMRGQVVFGWDEKELQPGRTDVKSRSTSDE